MKRISYLFLICISILNFYCKKNKKIIYPDKMSFGENILAKEGGNLEQHQYSFGAKLAKKSTLKIVLTNSSSTDLITGAHPLWFYDSPSGWKVDDYDFTNNTQTFTSISTDNIDLRIQFDRMGANTPGSCKIDFYENGKLHHSNKFNW